MIPATETELGWQRFLEAGLLGAAQLLNNASVDISALQAEELRVPLVTNRPGAADCSWVTSLRNSYGVYARAETDLVKMPRGLRMLYRVASHAVEQLFCLGGLSGGSFVNNWLLATNLYTTSFTALRISELVALASQQNPDLPVIVRSLTPPLHQQLLLELAASGFLLIPTRQVWIVTDPRSKSWRRHRDATRDLKLVAADRDDWTHLPGTEFTDADFLQASSLYQQLYRQRYPIYNPDYTTQFLKVGVAAGFLNLVGLRRRNQPNLSGFIGMVHRGDVSCTPLLGYDTTAPIEDGLYRRLMLLAFLECEQRQTIFHCSAGAGSFKYNRGAAHFTEFAAVWVQHLPAYRAAILKSVEVALRRCVVPYLEKHQL